jgi:CheY-like chemotaxis protein
MKLRILLVEDDEDSLNLLLQLLPKNLSGYDLEWDPCSDFKEAIQRLKTQSYDMVATDIYRDRKGEKKGSHYGDEKAFDIVRSIRGAKFCPILAFTDGSFPESFSEGPFIKIADKTRGDKSIVEKLTALLNTKVPSIARRLRDELDSSASTYLWGFLESNWEDLVQSGMLTEQVLERLIRRRAAVQIGRLVTANGQVGEVGVVEGLEFYICPSLSPGEYRLGEIVQQKGTKEFRVILTPHCQLVKQQGAPKPRAEFVLTAKTCAAKAKVAEACARDKGRLPRCLQSPADVGKPNGRYWFLPSFLSMPDLLCDFLQLESVPYDNLGREYDPFAVLDAPFAEALQSCFTRFYSAVGLPNLNPDRFAHLTK